MSLRRFLKDDPGSVALIQSFQKAVPVDIAGIAKALGLALYEDDLPREISGKIFRDPRNGGSTGYSIIVRGADALPRKRFTAAHEISHYLLHRRLLGDEIQDNALYRSRLSDGIERQANELAAEILMPVSLMQELLGAGVTEPGTLADKFKVSETALRIRMGSPV